MNIFVLDRNPITAARMHCDKHVPKMCVEVAQMMASALRRHGATDEQMPLTKAGKPYKGGYAHHPCTVWAGDSRDNFGWLALHGVELLREYDRRFNNVDVHACHGPIHTMLKMILLIPMGDLTPFALAMPDEYRPEPVNGEIVYHAYPKFAIEAYRRYYHSKQFAKWEKGTPAPDWWRGVEVTA
tara:strand:+ start:203 stop:754 length:552 start_codon:yes stop_codon:yes gene_type:complete